jgi:hypothetical protein
MEASTKSTEASSEKTAAPKSPISGKVKKYAAYDRLQG